MNAFEQSIAGASTERRQADRRAAGREGEKKAPSR